MLRGTRYRIGVDPADGLVRQGVDGAALPWMDARVDGRGVTPRIVKPVEVNALWVNALGTLRELRSAIGTADGRMAELERQARESFLSRFPTGGGGLRNVVDAPDGPDGADRPYDPTSSSRCRSRTLPCATERSR